ncbi:MAG: heavy-metal-associated domain-containing protein [Melioribacter sp.]|nr:heavy-metal-associated domain-containing protein [Melioribacter sp.]
MEFSKMITKEFKIEGMTCNHCVMAVKKELSKLNVSSFEVGIGFAKVNFDETKVSQTEIENAISDSGYKVQK